ncbi:MAG: histidine phosphatase family protein [Micromonosporaceae bacterium]
MTVLYLVRHGETAWHTDNRYCGRTDLPLTGRGLRQAQALATWAAGAGLDAVFSSTLLRARDTAVLAAQAAGVAHRTDERLVELDFGLAEGLTSAEMAQRWPAERAAFERDPAGHPLPGGEDPFAAIARGQAAVGEIVGRHPDGVVLVVCHSTFLRLLTCHLTAIDPSRYRTEFPKVANTSGAVLRHDSDGWRLLDFNPALAG